MPLPSIPASEKQLWQRLEQARAAAFVPVSREDVSGLVREIVSSLEGDLTVRDLQLYTELESLARYIQHTKAEISQIRPEEIRDSHIPAATDELDAVVGATESATNTIMDACDTIAAIAGRLDPENGAALTDVVTSVFEACNFQDVTGQRISKVIKALRHIEDKVDALVLAFGDHQAGIERRAAAATAAAAASAPAAALPPPGANNPDDPDSYLLHGPSLPGQAIDQDEIDRLLASFD